MNMLEKLKLQRYLKEETGVSLIMAIMTLFVLSIIGVTLATVTFANVKLTTTDREYQSAYYIAEAGVNETYAKIKKLILDSYDNTTNEGAFYTMIEQDISESTLDNFEWSLGKKPEAHISISKIDDGNPRTYQISSKGKIGQRERTVTKEFVVNWVPKNPLPYLPEGVGAIVKNKVDLRLGGGGRITGDVYLDTEVENRILMDGQAEVTGDVYGKGEADDSILSAPNWLPKPEIKPFGLEFDWEKLRQFIATLPSAPKDLPLQGDLIVNGDQELQLNGDYEYNDVIINNGKLKINVGNENHTLVFNTLQIYGGQAGIEIIGTGNVTIFIQKTFTSGGFPEVNINGKPEQLTIYYEEEETPIYLNSIDVNADFIVKKADVISGGGGVRKGLLISGGEVVEVVNGAKMDSIIVAPKAKVFLAQSSGYAGVIISDELTIGDDVRLEYKQLDDSDFLYNFITVPNESTTPGGGDTGGLLTPKPNIE